MRVTNNCFVAARTSLSRVFHATLTASTSPLSLFQLGYTVTMLRLVYEKVSQRKKLKRMIKRMKARSANRASFALPSPQPLVEVAEERLPLEDKVEGVSIS